MKLARTVLKGLNIVKYFLALTDPSNFTVLSHHVNLEQF
jgi:hypothetical protein